MQSQSWPNNSKPGDAERDLVRAVKEHDHHRIEVLLKEGTAPGALDIVPVERLGSRLVSVNLAHEELAKFAKSCLTLASSAGDIETVRLLLKYGADVNRADAHGTTAVIA